MQSRRGPSGRAPGCAAARGAEPAAAAAERRRGPAELAASPRLSASPLPAAAAVTYGPGGASPSRDDPRSPGANAVEANLGREAAKFSHAEAETAAENPRPDAYAARSAREKQRQGEAAPLCAARRQRRPLGAAPGVCRAPGAVGSVRSPAALRGFGPGGVRGCINGVFACVVCRSVPRRCTSLPPHSHGVMMPAGGQAAWQ